MCAKTKFSIQDTEIQKGIALLILIALHLFYRSEPAWQLFDYTSIVDGKPWITTLLKNGKICVDIFVFLSGYGLNESFNKKTKTLKDGSFELRFVIAHLFKLYISFWFIFFAFLIIGQFIGKINMTDVYGSGFSGLMSLIIEMFGLRDILFEWLHTGTINVTWWYMSLIVICYILFPLIKRIMAKFTYLPLTAFLLLNAYAPYASYRQISTGAFFYLSAFALGMLCSEKGLMDKLINLRMKQSHKIIYSILLVGITYIFCYYDRYNGELPHAISIIILVNVLFIEKNALLANIKQLPAFIGTHSANIFMFHTFILFWFESKVYQFGNPFIIWFSFLIVLLLISILIEYVKKKIKLYDFQQMIMKLIWKNESRNTKQI